MSSRDQILGKLRDAKRPFPTVTPPTDHQTVIPLSDTSPAALRVRFVQEAQKVNIVVHEATEPQAALAAILQVLGEDTAVSCWDPTHIPLPGLADALDEANVTRLGQDADVRVGITGVDAALAATGSLVLLSGNGRFRAASLLPPVHIAVLTAGQIVPDLESWWVAQKWGAQKWGTKKWGAKKAAGLGLTRQHSNVAIITGPSRTADIAMQLVLGMHGPRELHLVLLL